jgi:hypothetical protein
MIANDVYAQLALRVYSSRLNLENENRSNRPRVPDGWNKPESVS